MESDDWQQIRALAERIAALTARPLEVTVDENTLARITQGEVEKAMSNLSRLGVYTGTPKKKPSRRVRLLKFLHLI